MGEYVGCVHLHFKPDSYVLLTLSQAREQTANKKKEEEKARSDLSWNQSIPEARAHNHPSHYAVNAAESPPD